MTGSLYDKEYYSLGLLVRTILFDNPKPILISKTPASSGFCDKVSGDVVEYMMRMQVLLASGV